jgi:hypothetical protein
MLSLISQSHEHTNSKSLSQITPVNTHHGAEVKIQFLKIDGLNVNKRRVYSHGSACACLRRLSLNPIS